MATRKPMKKFKRYEGGGEVMGEMDPMEAAAKKRGLEMSNKEAPVGFFERLRAGNIDQPGTEAYNRFGAGRGYAQNMDDENEAMRAANRAPSAPAPSAQPLSNPMFSDYGPNTGMGAAGTSETVKPTRPAATKPVVPAKPAATPVPPLRNTGPDRSSLINKPPVYAGPLRGMRSDAGTSPPVATHGGPRDEEKLAKPTKPTKPTMDTKTMNENAKKAMADDPSSLMGMAGAGAAALFGASKLGKLFKGAKKAAGAGRDLVVSSSKKPSYMGKADDAKADKAREKLMKSSFIKKGGDDVTDVTAKKRGGAVKKYASGGMVSSASRRADGIATKGKTRCKIC